MPMPNRHTTDNNYRYAFQGQEKDPETGMEAFELRLWDGRIGRWLTIDPYHEFFSPYLGMGNNPISLIDPDGGSTEGADDNGYKGVWNEETCQYEYSYVDNTGGEFYDVIEFEGGELDGTTDIVINPYIKEEFNLFSENDYILDASIRRFGIGEWGHYNEAIIPGHFEEILPLPAIGKYLSGVKGKIVGNAQKTGTYGHSFVNKFIAYRMAFNPMVKKVTLDLGYKKLLTAGGFKYGPRPDVGVLYKNGKVKIYEVASKTDITKKLIERNENFMFDNNIKGTVKVSNTAKIINRIFRIFF
jgi:RHS repeat-associated protein